MRVVPAKLSRKRRGTVVAIRAMRALVALVVGCGIAGCAIAETEAHDATATILRRLAALEAEVAALKASATSSDAAAGAGAGRQRQAP